jgi:hypothetical protein
MNSLQNDDLLQRIQALQFQDKAAAEALLLEFVRQTFPDLNASAVELRPLAVSLNSFNGFLTLADGRRLFFKTHVEPGSVIHEYYNSKLLADAGYPVIQPVYSSTEYGKQLLIYDVIESPSVFDVARAIERGERDDLAALTEAQHRADADLLQIYLSTFEMQPAEEAAKAAVHQLFYHRLGTRYEQFYAGKTLDLPGACLAWDELLRRKWIVNGNTSDTTLSEAIGTAGNLLNLEKIAAQLKLDSFGSVVGHGDAHNGNVFFIPEGLMYFDPAFGGRHHPLMDLAKPLFHNVFATWMYHPQEVATTLNLDWRDDGTTITVEHDYRPSACRRMFFESKIELVFKPLLDELRKRGDPFFALKIWKSYLKSALMCCPLLTMNLADSNRFPPTITLLGLCYTVEMGIYPFENQYRLLDSALFDN